MALASCLTFFSFFVPIQKLLNSVNNFINTFQHETSRALQKEPECMRTTRWSLVLGVITVDGLVVSVEERGCHSGWVGYANFLFQIAWIINFCLRPNIEKSNF